IFRRSGRGFAGKNKRQRPTAGFSSLLLVLDIAADDLADVGVLFLGLLDEGGVVLVAALHLDVLDVLDPFGRRFLGAALGLGIGLLERNELGLLRLRHIRLGRLRGGGAC